MGKIFTAPIRKARPRAIENGLIRDFGLERRTFPAEKLSAEASKKRNSIIAGNKIPKPVRRTTAIRPAQ
jgi:hypothetical protein